MNSRSYLLHEFSSPKRLEILHMLAEGPIKFTKISKKLEISSSEVSRHLTRLVDQGFIQKNQTTREFELATLGEVVNCLMLPLDFVFNSADYFRKHTIMELPISIIRDIDILEKFELISGTGFVMIKLPEIINSAEKETKVMTSQPFPRVSEKYNSFETHWLFIPVNTGSRRNQDRCQKAPGIPRNGLRTTIVPRFDIFDNVLITF